MAIYLYIGDNGNAYLPAVQEGIEWSTERRGVPGKITFQIINDDTLQFSEGSMVLLKEDDKGIFMGYVFKQNRDKEGITTVTAYDQLRYFKNKDTFIYENKTLPQVVQMLADDYDLRTGTLEDSGFVIASRVEQDTSLFEITENAIDIVLQNTGKMYVLYDDAGSLTLKSLESMYVGSDGKYLVIDSETGENFDYTSSIDDVTYNKIVLKNNDTDKDFVVADDLANIAKWGTLTYTDTYKPGENAQAKAQSLLNLYNHKTRNLKIPKAFGDSRVRAGSMVVVNLDLGDIKVQNFMLVEKCTHTYNENEHWMSLTLRGGDFIA